ncbi:hypothetical protein BDV25DRAFT_64097 [Aspergillus avenaceus]|uniref:Uncharacterized protein n=1 Tax=Aspergillus avenaceus TaxID=36643 RepID=A0A5N6U8N9_ASPAV|nr:hypothetical protein BDV25DRAFT_64097 [Aspergillus avenaceus]
MQIRGVCCKSARVGVSFNYFIIFISFYFSPFIFPVEGLGYIQAVTSIILYACPPRGCQTLERCDEYSDVIRSGGSRLGLEGDSSRLLR